MWIWSPEMVHNSVINRFISWTSSRPVFWFVLLSRSLYCFRWHPRSQSQILYGNVRACSTSWTMTSRIPPSNSKYPTSRLRIVTNPGPAKTISSRIPPLKCSISRLDFRPHLTSRQTYFGPSSFCYSENNILHIQAIPKVMRSYENSAKGGNMGKVHAYLIYEQTLLKKAARKAYWQATRLGVNGHAWKREPAGILTYRLQTELHKKKTSTTTIMSST